MANTILFFAGSVKSGSLNVKLAKAACTIASQDSDINAQFIDLNNYDMPIFSEDIETNNGMPKNAAAFKSLLQNANGFFIASPEYNGFFTPLLKNAIDWASRSHTSDMYNNDTETFKGKVAGIAGTSPGGLGALRGLPHLRVLLSGIGTHVIPHQTAIGGGFKAFDDNGNLTQDNHIAMLTSQIEQLTSTVKSFNA